MSREEEVTTALVARFSALAPEVRRARRVWATVPAGSLVEVMSHARDALGFVALCTITGLDEGEDLGFLYHLADRGGIVLTLHARAPKASPEIPSVNALFPGSIFYERELVDLFGAVVVGLPPGDRYPLQDDWPEGQYPLRKDWTPDRLDAARRTDPGAPTGEEEADA